MVASFSACSPEPSRKAEQDPKLRGSLALQLTEAEKLAKKEKDREGALQFVRLAQEACKELSGKTVALTDSTGDLSAMNSLIPPEFYPSESFAAYVDGATFEEVKSQLNGAATFEVANTADTVSVAISVPESEWKKALETRLKAPPKTTRPTGLRITSTEPQAEPKPQVITTDPRGNTVTLSLPGKR